MAVRTTRIEIAGFSNMSEERKKSWKMLVETCQKMKNRLWKLWVSQHVAAGNDLVLAKHFADMQTVVFRDVGERPIKPRKPKRDAAPSVWGEYERSSVKYEEDLANWQLRKAEVKAANQKEFPCKVMVQDEKYFYHDLGQHFPQVNKRTISLLIQKWAQNLRTRKSANGSIKGWVSILLEGEQIPSFTKPQPVPFDKQNSKLFTVDKQDPNSGAKFKKYYCELRIERLPHSGDSVVERCELVLGKRKTLSIKAIVDRCISGEYAFKGSELLFHDGKWYIMLAYDKPQDVVPNLDQNKIMYVKPGRRFPWLVKIGSSKTMRYLAGNGRNVEHWRRDLDRQRRERMSHYRYSAGSNRKGRGQKHAIKTLTQKSEGWKGFCKSFNNNTTAKLIQEAIRHGCGTIVYLQPGDEHKKAKRFLNVAGSNAHCRLTWDYFQFGSMLSFKCQDKGIECVIKKTEKVDRFTANGVCVVRRSGRANSKKRTES